MRIGLARTRKEGNGGGGDERIRSMTKKKSIGGGSGGGYIMDAWLTTLYHSLH